MHKSLSMQMNVLFCEIYTWLMHMCSSVCSVAYVSRSGGMSNELNNIISLNTDGVFEGIAIGGDRYLM